MKKDLGADSDWDKTLWGRIDQARRELAVVLKRDITVERLAEMVGLAGPSLTGWKQGAQPKKESIEKLARLFQQHGLMRYTARFLDYGPDAPHAPAVAHDRLTRPDEKGPAQKKKGA